MKRIIAARHGYIFGLIFAFLLMFSFTMSGMEVATEKRADTDIKSFSASGALMHMQYLAGKPHPRGSEEHGKVREYIIGAIKEDGLEPVTEEYEYIDEYLISKPTKIMNIMTRIPGTNSTGTLLVVSHYDSMPDAPGASDDGTAVASMLENLRIAKEGPPLKNDVVFLFTDGEEEHLLGAGKFVKESPWMKDVRFVLNFEARGTTGPVLMFETTEGDFQSVREFIRSGNDLISNSLLKELYKLMPNSTDFTQFQRVGIQGLNFAYIYNGINYHTPLDSLENIDMDTFKQQGEAMLASIRHFGELDLGKLESGENAVFFNVFKGIYVVYPETLAVVFAVLAVILFGAALWLGIRSCYISIKRTIGGFVSHGIIWAAVFFSLPYIQKFMELFSHNLARKMQSGAYFSGSLFLGCMLISLALTAALYTIPGKRFNGQDLFAGSIFWWILLTIISTVFIPAGSYLFTWMAVLEATALLILIKYRKKSQEEGGILNLLPAVPIMLLIPLYLPIIVVGAQGLGMTNWSFIALFIVIIIAFLLSLLTKDRRRVLIASAVVMAAGIVLVIAEQAVQPVNIEDPRANLSGGFDNRIRYIYDRGTGAFKWAVFDDDIYYFVKKIDSDKYTRENIKLGWQAWVKEAPDLKLPPAEVKVISDESNNGLRILKLDIKALREDSKFFLITENKDGIIKKASIDGEYTKDTEGTREINISGLGSMELTITSTPGEELEFIYYEFFDDEDLFKSTQLMESVKGFSDHIRFRAMMFDSYEF